MANDDSVLNQDLNSGTSFSPAHKHLQDDSPETVVSPKNEQAALDRLGIESARRAAHRFQRNASVSRLTQRSPSNASDFRDAFLSTVTALGAAPGIRLARQRQARSRVTPTSNASDESVNLARRIHNRLFRKVLDRQETG